MTTGRMFVIAVDSVDAALVEEFLNSMYEHKELRYTVYRKGAERVLVAKRIKLLFSYPTDHTGRCLDHQGGGNGSAEDGERQAPQERKLPGRRLRR